MASLNINEDLKERFKQWCNEKKLKIKDVAEFLVQSILEGKIAYESK